MKLFLALTISTIFGIILAIDFNDEYAQKVQDYCKSKEGASDEDIENIFNGSLPETRSEKCLVACLSERYGTVELKKQNH